MVDNLFRTRLDLNTDISRGMQCKMRRLMRTAFSGILMTFIRGWMPSSSNSSTHANLFSSSRLCLQLVKISSFCSRCLRFNRLLPSCLPTLCTINKTDRFWNPMKLFHDQIESAAVFQDGKTSKQSWESQTLSSEPVAEQGFRKKTVCYYEESIATSREQRRWIQSRTIHVFVLFSLRFNADNRALDQESSDREMLFDFSLAQSTPSAPLYELPDREVGVVPPSISVIVCRVQGHASLFVARN